MKARLLVGCALCSLLLSAQIGPGNRAAAEIASKSPLVQASMSVLRRTAGQIQDEKIRTASVGLLKPGACILHRAGLTESKKAEIVKSLIEAGLAEPGDNSGIFPPVIGDGGVCPTLPQPFEAAPGSGFGGHHSYPGGLAVHEAFNLRSGLNFVQLYERIYGPGEFLMRDLLIAAPIWHDWAKAIVLQWNADGTETRELSFGGRAGVDTKTPAHHILGLAEAMKRDFPANLIVTQASSHAAPVLGNENKVANWIRAAAIIAQVDPVAKGYLPVHFVPEAAIHNLSDADFVLSIPAATTADKLLLELASEFGYDPSDTARYNNRFRNPALSYLSAERILFLNSSTGIDAVRGELKKLRSAKVL